MALAAHEKATDLLNYLVSEIKESVINKYWSFCVFPDGSKEGWEESDEYDKRRDLFVKWLEAQRWDDGSSSYQAVLVSYDDNDKVTSDIIS